MAPGNIFYRYFQADSLVSLGNRMCIYFKPILCWGFEERIIIAISEERPRKERTIEAALRLF